MATIQEQIDQQDLSLFKTIESQSSEDDRRSFLALNSAFRQWKGGRFTFLEIGSYKGGSLQSYVADPGCAKIISIGPRPKFVIEFGKCHLSQSESMRSWRDQNYKGYLCALVSNDVFRTTAREYWRIAEHPAFKLPHKLGLVKVAKRLMGGGRKKK